MASSLPEFAISGGNGAPSHNPRIDGLPERAMLGEAALQALMKVPKNRLDEGTFDIIAKSVARIGKVVLRSAHGLIEEYRILDQSWYYGSRPIQSVVMELLNFKILLAGAIRGYLL